MRPQLITINSLIMKDIKIIQNEEEYEIALREIDKLFHAKPGTPEGNRLELLLLLVEHYEKQHHPIEAPDPIEAIKFRMDQLNMSVTELGEIIGYKSRASEILNRKRRLTLPMLRKLHDKLGISAEILLQEY